MAFKKLRVPQLQLAKASSRVKAFTDSSLSSWSQPSLISLASRLISLRNNSTKSLPSSIQYGLSNKVSGHVALAGGCYWGLEALLQEFDTFRPGAIKKTQCGFMSPYYNSEAGQPTYEEVMTGTSGYLQVVLVELVNPQADFEELIRFFFKIHDPTTRYKQGNEKGFQFSSWIFCGDQEQYQVAKRIRSEVQELLDNGLLDGVYDGPSVTTNMSIMGEFTLGPEEHQRYVDKHPDTSCAHYMRFKTWPDVLDDTWSHSAASEQEEDEEPEEERPHDPCVLSLRLRSKESLIHTMIRISMYDEGDDM